MEYLIILGVSIATMIGLSFTRHKDITKTSWSKVSEFISFMVLVTILRIAIYSYLIDMGEINTFPTLPMEIETSKWTLALVFWEDVFFGMPLYFIHKYMNDGFAKYVKWTLTIMISLLFGLGHAYQGLFAVALTSLYPYFISKKYGERHGFGTVAICHIIYDNMTVYMIALLPYLLG